MNPSNVFFHIGTLHNHGRCHKKFHLPWLPSCLDCGALINVDGPGFGTSVVRDPTGHK